MSSIRDAIIAASRPAPVQCSVDGISSPLFVRVLTVGEIVAQDDDVKDEKNRPAIARALCRVLCDSEGNKEFDYHKQEDIDVILTMPWHIVRAIMKVANDVNGLRVGDGAEPAKN